MEVPNNAPDAERSVLSCVLLDEQSYYEINLRPEAFYHTKNRKIWEAIKALIDKEKPVSLVTITEKLRKDKDLDMVGGTPYLLQIINAEPTSAAIKHYASMLTKCHVKRQMQRLASKIVKDLSTGGKTGSQVIEDTYKALDNISMDSTGKDFKTGRDCLKAFMDKVEEESFFISTGFKSLDNLIDGFEGGSLYILGAGTGVGKSAFMTSIIGHLIETEVKPAIFSFEMSDDEIICRLLSTMSMIEARRIKNNKIKEIEYSKYNKAIAQIDGSDIAINDNPYITLSKLMAQSRKLVKNKGIQILFVDHIGILNRDAGNNLKEHEWLKHVSDSLKRLAKELKIPVVALSQLKWDDQKAGAMPTLHSLHGSKGIAEAANGVILLHRELEDVQKDCQNTSVLLRKNRGGSIGRFECQFLAPIISYREG